VSEESNYATEVKQNSYKKEMKKKRKFSGILRVVRKLIKCILKIQICAIIMIAHLNTRFSHVFQRGKIAHRFLFTILDNKQQQQQTQQQQQQYFCY